MFYSASDVVNFRECEQQTILDLVNLDALPPKAEDDDEAILYQTKGLVHEHSRDGEQVRSEIKNSEARQWRL